MKALSILCPQDFTALSETAAHAAAALARRCGGTLELLHVLPESEGDEKLGETLRRGAEARLNERIASLQGKPGSITARVIHAHRGDRVRAAVLRRAEELKPDLLVVSTGGHSGSGGWLMGSMAAALVQESPVPVLVVRDAASLITWADGSAGPLRVTASLDLDETGRQVLNAVHDLNFARNSALYAVHVRRIATMPAGIGDPMPMIYPDPIGITVLSEEEATASLRQLLDETLPGVPAVLQTDAAGVDPVAIVSGIADSMKDGLLVMGSHHRNAFDRFLAGSVSNALLHSARTNVLCIPVEDRPMGLAETDDPESKPDSVPAAAAESAPAPAITGPVLCATDFSMLGNDAVLGGRAFALRMGHPWRLVHALDSSRGDTNEADESLTREGAEVKLRKLAEDGSLAPESVTVIHRDAGQSVVNSLAGYARDTGAAMLAVSTHGRSGSAWWPIGSTAVALAESASCPVLVTSDSAPLLRWAERRRGIGVLAGIDPAEDHSPVFAWLRLLLEAGGCRIVLAAVVAPNPVLAGEAMVVPAPGEDETITKTRLHEIAAKHLPARQIDCAVLHGATGEALIHATNEYECDLIVLGTHQRHGLGRLLHGSVSRAVLGRSPCSVLCVPLTR